MSEQMQKYDNDNFKNVVHCRDCEYYTSSARRCDHPQLDYDIECYDHWLETEPDDFCSYGNMRKKEKQENDLNGRADTEGKTLKRMLLDEGYPESKMYHHCKDLYVFVTPVTTKVINEWSRKLGYNKDWHCPTFKDLITGTLMYDCAFQWYEKEEK